MEICRLLIEAGTDCNAICLGRVEKDCSDIVTSFDKHLLQVRTFTALYLFSQSGVYPTSELETLLTSRGAAAIAAEKETFEQKDAESEAWRAAVVEALSKSSLIQPAKVKPASKKINKWRRKWMDFTRPDLQFVGTRC
jgi:hypothetical protein